MCQARSDGGKRCPVHRHESVAYLKAISAKTGMNRRQAERLLAELRREGRGAELMTAEERSAQITALKQSVEGTDAEAGVTSALEKADSFPAEPDAQTDYAYRIFAERAESRATAIKARFDAVATRTGLSVQEVEEKFNELFDAVDISRGSGNQNDEYNTTVRARYVRANLPFDRQSIVAFEKLNNLQEAETERRVTLINAREGSHVRAFGYDDGRLEISFHSNPDMTYAYQNVPQELWERLRDADRPGSVYARSIRGNADYVYQNAEEAEADAFRLRCASCGQFRAAAHECPGREVREAITASNAEVTAEEVQEIVAAQSNTEVDEEGEEIVPPVAPADDTAIDPIEDTVEHAIENTEPVLAPAENFVVAAPDMEAYTGTSNLLNTQAPVTRGHEDTAVTALPNLPEIPTPTQLGQLQPAKFDASTLVVSTVEHNRQDDDGHLTTLKGGYSEDHYRSYNMNDADAATMSSADADIMFVAKVKYGDGARDGIYSQLMSSYDTKTHTARDVNRYPNQQIEISRKGHQVSLDDYPMNAAEQRQYIIDNQNAIQDLVPGTARWVGAVASRTSRFTFDANLPADEQPNLRLGRVADIRSLLKDNMVAVLPFTFDSRGYRSGTYVDDQGFQVDSIPSNVEGNVMVRRGPNGTIEVISDERSLKCSCSAYRRNYRCRHLNYIQRHIGNAVQQATVASSVGRTRTERPEGAHPLLTSALLRRQGVEVKQDEATGNDYVSFGTNVNSRQRLSSWGNYRMTLPEPLGDNPTGLEQGQYARDMDALNSMYNLTVADKTAEIRAALKRSDVETPISVNFGSSTAGTAGTVTGSLLIEKNRNDDLDGLTVRSHTLKCTCPEYQEKYDCPHVRVAARQGYAALTVGRATSRFDRGVELNRMLRLRESEDENYAVGLHILAAAQEDFRAARNEHDYENDATPIPQFYNQVETFNTRQEAAAERIAELRRIEEERERARLEEQRAAERQRQERERARLEELRAANSASVENSATYRENMMSRWQNVDEGYSENGAAFYEDYKAALTRKRNGEDAVKFRTENVTDGVCGTGPGSRQFGVELEFDIKPGVDRYTALRNIGRELHEAGLTNDSEQHRYHSAAQNGYAKWSFEQDCTVDAELVSPILSDTPEHWEQLRKATEIINRNGGVASTRTGSHVHVSTASYEKSTAKHAELLRELGSNNDIMYRLASNPARGTHRGTQWCAPNTQDVVDTISSDEVVSSHRVLGYNHSSHNVYLNFEGTGRDEFHKSNVEFRMWDGTLDPAVIQQQVVISAALTDYAERRVIENGSSPVRTGGRNRIDEGKNREQEVLNAAGVQTHTQETFVESHEKVAEFFDKLFRRREDRAAATSLLAVTNWQRG